MLGASINFKFLQLCSTQTCLRHHTTHGGFNDALWVLLEHFSCARAGQTANVVGVSVVVLVLPLVTSEHHFIGIYNDDKVARIRMRRKLGLGVPGDNSADWSGARPAGCPSRGTRRHFRHPASLVTLGLLRRMTRGWV